MDPVAEIKARLSIDELVGQYCQIQKKGRNFVAKCPFHNDTKPSLLISPDKGIAYCFPCQKGGDVFTFYQEIEGVDFRQALKDLAEKVGIELPRAQFTAKGPTKDVKERLRECLEESASFYNQKLQESEMAKTYLQERHIPEDLRKEFTIGYAPDSFDATYTHLLKKGFSRSEILQAGMGIQKELQQERIYDRFRNRLMFPIHDHQGNIVGFGGRALGHDDAKYINSPDGVLYNKSVALFGLARAKEHIRNMKSVILVEGYFDVLAFHRIGIKNVVALSGTALTEQHVGMIKRSAESILLCLDRDEAGEKAAERAFILCKDKGLDVRSITIPHGKDPDECANIAPEELKLICEKGGELYLDALFHTIANSEVENRLILKQIAPLLNIIPSSVEREEYIVKAAELLGTTVTALKDDLTNIRQAERLHDREQSRVTKSIFGSVDLFFGLILNYPKHLNLIKDLLEPESEQQKELYHALKVLNADATEREIQKNDLPEKIQEYASVLQLYCEEHFDEWSEDLARLEIRKIEKKVNMDILRRKQKQLIEAIRGARTEGKKLEEEKLLTQYQQVLTLAAKVK